MANTPTPPTPCPPWCTRDHAVGPTHHGDPLEPATAASTTGRPVYVNVFLASDITPGRSEINIVHSGADEDGNGYSGTTLLLPREGPGVAALLRALGHAEIADALDKAAAILGGAS
jgi:hypothetical protein